MPHPIASNKNRIGTVAAWYLWLAKMKQEKHYSCKYYLNAIWENSTNMCVHSNIISLIGLACRAELLVSRMGVENICIRHIRQNTPIVEKWILN